MLFKAVLTRDFAVSVRSVMWNDVLRQLIIAGDKVQIWGLWTKKTAKTQWKKTRTSLLDYTTWRTGKKDDLHALR